MIFAGDVPLPQVIDLWLFCGEAGYNCRNFPKEMIFFLPLPIILTFLTAIYGRTPAKLFGRQYTNP
jgi:hypothetical protein